MIPTFDTLMINSKRKADAALAVYCVYARLNGGCFFKNAILKQDGRADMKKLVRYTIFF